MSYDEDPEVRADIQLRARTERERKTSRVPVWVPPEIAARWPCRACGSFVGVTGDAVERFILFSEMLKRRGEAPLDVARIVFCDSCRAEGKRLAPERARAQVEKLRELIVRLKRSGNPERDRELILQIEKLGHPDVPGLVQAIRDRIASKGRKPERGAI